ncbi:serine/threonine protein kinase [Lentisphaerota bacterium ZTH]|nr:protein kinase [Lentisphaerota bacterium]WET06802.1 serine/threonine protein kinase [Lentisphaerota bacterium ZTH]
MTAEKKADLEATQKIPLPPSGKAGAGNAKKKQSEDVDLNSTRKLFWTKKRVADDLIRSTSKPSLVTNLEPVDKTLFQNRLDDVYELKEKFSEGAQGELRFAFDKALKREVAVKSLKKDSDPESAEADIRLFVSEARIMAKLDHPAIIPLYGLHCDSKRGFYLVMKHISGKTLEEYLRDTVALYQTDGIKQYNEHRSIGIRLEFFLKICEAVEYAHSKGIIHRDIKPANIMIGDFGEIYVMDWGLAGLLTEEQEQESKEEKNSKKGTEKSQNYRAGTPSYMAPELIQGEKYSPQTDIFALGMILFEMVTLKKAVNGDSVNEVLGKILHCNFNSFKHRFPKVRLSRDMKAIIAKAICCKSRRYKSVAGLAEDVKLFLMREEVSARPDNLIRKWIRCMSNHKLATFSAVLLILLGSSGLTIASLFKQNRIIRETRQREIILTRFQNEVIEKGHSIERLFLHLKGLLSSSAVLAGDLLSHKGLPSLPRIYTNKDYSDPATAPPDLQYFPSYNRKISLEFPVFKVAPGVDPVKAKDTIRKIFPLINSFKNVLFSSDPAIEDKPVSVAKDTIMYSGLPVSWIYIGLQDGLFMSYPGKGGYEEDYDPRQRPWYKVAFDREAAVWSKPYLCASGQGIVIACTEGIFDLKQNFCGVISMDVSFNYITRHLFGNGRKCDLKKYLLDQSGKIIVSTDYNKSVSEASITKNSFLNLKNFPFSKIFKQATANNGGLYRAGAAGKKYVFVFAYIPTVQWYYVEQISERDLHLRPID